MAGPSTSVTSAPEAGAPPSGSEAGPGVSRRTFWEVARQPRLLGVLALLLLAAAVCGRLGMWQLDRAYERAELADKQAAVEAAAAGPEGLGSLLAPQESFPGELVGRQAWVTGTFEPAGEKLVAGRVVDGQTGFLVLTPLRVSDDGTGGASWADLSGAPVLGVVRGFVTSPADVPAPPSGEVTLTGWLQASEATAGTGGLPPGQTDRIAVGALVQEWGGPTYGGYLVESEVADGLAQPGRPIIDGGTGVNLQNAFYALQWWVFGGFAVALWLRLVRDEMAGGRRGGQADDEGIAGLPGPTA